MVTIINDVMYVTRRTFLEQYICGVFDGLNVTPILEYLEYGMEPNKRLKIGEGLIIIPNTEKVQG